MIPITKNITVVDKNGKEYEPTYLRRAQGLVKHGRARFVAGDTICLTRPPDEIMEDKLMSDNKNLAGPDNVNPTIKHDMSIAEKISKEQKNESKVSIEYIMEKINQILEDKQHIVDTIDALRNFKNNDSMNGGMGDAGKAEALGIIVRSREQTNQQLLTILSKMFDHHIGLI